MQIALQRPRQWDAVYVKWKMSANYDMKYEHIPKCNKTHHATPPSPPLHSPRPRPQLAHTHFKLHRLLVRFEND